MISPSARVGIKAWLPGASSETELKNYAQSVWAYFKREVSKKKLVDPSRVILAVKKPHFFLKKRLTVCPLV